MFAAINSYSQDTILNVQYFVPEPGISIRALEVLDDSTVWFAANRGVWGFTEDAGKSWHIDSIKTDSVYPEFRSIAALNDSTVLLLSIASPAYLFKTTNKGKNWRLVYKNENRNIFFDSMKFWDSRNGIAIGDPINGCFQIILTNDGGNTWNKINCQNIPEAVEGESLFASSNSSIDIYQNHVWFVTGGKYARVFHSDDFGRHFQTAKEPAPISQGGKMTGIFSIDFKDNNTGIIVGGNYEKTDVSISNMSIFSGRGIWEPYVNSVFFFGSCVQFKSSDVFFVTGHDGTFICNYKRQQIKEVKDMSGSPLKFHTLRFSPSGKILWLAGLNGKIASISLGIH